MKRFWPLVLLILPVAVLIPFLPLRRIAWRLTSGEEGYPSWIVWFMSRQRPDGSWNEGPATLEGHPLNRPGTTGLALLTFLGARYSHLSKDQYEWHDVGPCVKSGLEWIMRDQLPDGTFQSSAGTLDHTLATLALSEAYGLTGSNRFKNEAQKATDALVEMVLSGQLKEDASLHAWAAGTIASAEIAGLQVKREAFERIRGFYDARVDQPADAGEIWTRIMFDKKKDHPRLAPGADRLVARPPRWDQQDYASWYWGSLALYQYDGPDGAAWKAWNDPLRTTLVNSHSSRGDWPGRNRGETFVQTCQASLTLMIYYRYANVFGTARGTLPSRP